DGLPRAVHPPRAPRVPDRRDRRHRAVVAGRQPDDPRRRRAVPARRRAGRGDHVAVHRRDVRRAVRDRPAAQGRAGPRDRRRGPGRGGAARDGLPGVVGGGERPGHGEGDAGFGERAGDDRRPGRPPGRRDPRRRRRRPVRAPPRGGGRGRGGQDAGGEGGRDPGGVPPRRARPRPVRAARPPARTRHRVRRVLRVLRGAGAVSGGLRCMLMRGGTSKGAYFLADDLPSDPAERDDLLLRVMGTPDPRQIDGIGGADPLTSKVAVVSASRDPDADVDYLFLQVGVEEPTVSDGQNCGNLLAGVGPFAVERGLAAAGGDRTSVRIRMVNSGSVATATFPTPGGVVSYDGDTAVSGVPGTAAPVLLDFAETEGSSCGSLLPTGRL